MDPPLFHATDKDCCCMGFPFDVNHAPGVRHGQFDAEAETVEAAEEADVADVVGM